MWEAGAAGRAWHAPGYMHSLSCSVEPGHSSRCKVNGCLGLALKGANACVPSGEYVGYFLLSVNARECLEVFAVQFHIWVWSFPNPWPKMAQCSWTCATRGYKINFEGRIWCSGFFVGNHMIIKFVESGVVSIFHV